MENLIQKYKGKLKESKSELPIYKEIIEDLEKQEEALQLLVKGANQIQNKSKILSTLIKSILPKLEILKSLAQIENITTSFDNGNDIQTTVISIMGDLEPLKAKNEKEFMAFFEDLTKK